MVGSRQAKQETSMRAIAASVVMFFLASVAAAQQLSSKPDRLMVNIDTQKTMPPVSKYEYGMFTEHIRDSMYRAVWTEMLDDRKFYFPIPSTPDRKSTRLNSSHRCIS